jgi:2-amino-4-hydroxy-6-hydroxymethyldihydropteridine diphosphokinase
VIELALVALDVHFGVERRSDLYGFPAWPDPSDPPFFNAVAALGAAPPPAQLLQALHAIEASFGRRRGRKNAPRTLDLDLLAYGDHAQEGPPALPHPGLEVRDFVLVPLADIAPGFRSPRSGRTVEELLSRLRA